MNYFTKKELMCPCCGVSKFDDELLAILNNVRNLIGRPIVLNSAYRCKKHNKKVGGVANSAHIYGKAVDIKCNNSSDRFELVSMLMKCGIRRIGIGKNLVHGDIDKTKSEFVIWVY